MVFGRKKPAKLKDNKPKKKAGKFKAPVSKKKKVRKETGEKKKPVKKKEKAEVKKPVEKKEGMKGKEARKAIPKMEKIKLSAVEKSELQSRVVYPLITEKSVNMIEAENKLVFVVQKKLNKTQVKEAIEKLYEVKVEKVNMLNDSRARKRAFVSINKVHKADEIATKLGVL